MRHSIRFKRALVAVFLGALAGCGSDLQPTGPSAASAKAKPSPAGHTTAVAVCDQQTYAVTSQRVGPAGGKIKAGKHEFAIPRGALSFTVRITMEAVADSVHSVRFSPAGLVFNAAHLPKLKLSYKGCKIPKGAKKQVAYVTETLSILSILRAVDDTLNSNVGSQLEHFSRYAVAW